MGLSVIGGQESFTIGMGVAVHPGIFFGAPEISGGRKSYREKLIELYNEILSVGMIFIRGLEDNALKK